jgi:PRC-barrel domain
MPAPGWTDEPFSAEKFGTSPESACSGGIRTESDMRYLAASTLALVLVGTGGLAQESQYTGEGGQETGETGFLPEKDTGTGGGMQSSQGGMGEGVGTGAEGGAGTAMPPPQDTMEQGTERSGANLIRTRDITGGGVYTMSQDDGQADGWDPTNYYDRIDSGWNQVGQIEDLVLSRSGQLTGLVAEVGGFLDVGDKHVLIQLGDVNLVATDDREYAYVTRLSEEDLMNMQDVDEGFWE